MTMSYDVENRLVSASGACDESGLQGLEGMRAEATLIDRRENVASPASTAANGAQQGRSLGDAGKAARRSAPERGEGAIERGRRIAREELARTRRIGPPRSGHNDRYDAERHARWVYRMAKEIGFAAAQAFYTQHELEGLANGQPFNEYQMDMHNNKVGLDAALRGEPIPSINDSRLVVIEPDGSLSDY
jgi:hypothetical protein